jgi:hypothetical protein
VGLQLGVPPLFAVNAKRTSILALLTAALAAVGFYTLTPSRALEHGANDLDRPLAAAFHIFRTPTETPSGPEARRIGAGINGLAEIASTQLVITEHGRLWVFRTGRQACIGHTRGMACTPWRKAVREGLVLGVFDPPDKHRRGLHNFLIQGLAPDDVGGVQVLINNSRYSTVDVEENVFSAAADKPIHVKWLLRD